MTTLSIVHYHKFKNFCYDTFIKDITALSKLHSEENVLFKKFRESINKTLGKHAPLKKDILELISLPLWIKNWLKKSWKGHVWETSF